MYKKYLRLQIKNWIFLTIKWHTLAIPTQR